MSETNAQEPTMEEILASIRRIISEDDPPAEAAAAPAPAAAAPAAVAPAAVAEAPAPAAVEPPKAKAKAAAPPPPPPEPVAASHEEDVLELTDPVEPPAAPHSFQETVGDLDVFSSAPPVASSFTSAPSFPAEPLTGSYASETSANHFGALARSMSMPKDGRTLEDVVRELLKPLLRDWLDQHLSGIVEARVQAEVERIARRNEY